MVEKAELKKLGIEGLVRCEHCGESILAKDAIMVSTVEITPKILCVHCLVYFLGKFLRHD